MTVPSGLRWRVVALLFASTVINYLDRQTLSVLAPHLKTEFGWTNSDFALLIIAFRVAYTVGQAGCGRILDRLGTRMGLTVAVAWYSAIAMATSLVTGLKSFGGMRFLLGLGESANWPGATKAVSEWVPAQGEGAGGGDLRQWFVDWGGGGSGVGDLAVHDVWRLAAGVPGDGCSGVRVAAWYGGGFTSRRSSIRGSGLRNWRCCGRTSRRAGMGRSRSRPCRGWGCCGTGRRGARLRAGR
ncbi:MAG: MFS transporter [Paludibaculum sp.]